MILGVDIGGTKIQIAKVERRADKLEVRDVVRQSSDGFAGLGDVLRATRGDARLEGVGIGVAGPVFDRRVKLTNLPWGIDARELERELGVPVALMNDIEAFGHGLAHLDAGGFETLNEGKELPGNRALIAAGTGLGQGLLFWDGRRHLPSASEGGHTDFAPRDDDEIELLRFLRGRYERVSWERVVSGSFGFRNLYDFLSETKRVVVPAERAREFAGEKDVGHLVDAAARAGEPFAREIMRWFVRLYGSEAGNLGLKALSVGGLYVAGGIAQRHAERFHDGVFMNAFVAKGRFTPLLEAMPVRLVTDPHAALKGAAGAAMVPA